MGRDTRGPELDMVQDGQLLEAPPSFHSQYGFVTVYTKEMNLPMGLPSFPLRAITHGAQILPSQEEVQCSVV